MNEIPQHFSEFFLPEIANSEEKLIESYRMRHEVYCEELDFLDLHENGLESDEFDTRSIHLLIQNIASRSYAGTARLVLSSKKDELLPIEQFCGGSFYSDSTTPADLPRDTICEISRLAVSSDFRKRASDNFMGAAEGAINVKTYSEKEARCFPFIIIGLYLEIAAVCEKEGIKHFFVMMERKLARSAAFAGIKFHQIGSVIEYHGKRAAYYINLDMFHQDLSPNLRAMLDDIRMSLDNQSDV